MAVCVAGLLLALGATSTAQIEPLQASVVAVEITPPIGVPLAGYAARHLSFWNLFKYRKYATYFEPSTSPAIDPIQAKVLYLKKGSKRLVLITEDLIGADKRMRDALVKRLKPLGFADADILLSASHTHSGPGTISLNWVWQIAAADNYQHSIYKGILNKIYDGVVRATQTLEPAALSSYAFTAVDLQKNRREITRPVDPIANVLLVTRPDGSWIGSVINLAIHGTALAATNLHYSADVPGAMQRALEDALHANAPAPDGRRPVVLFVNGAEGDVAPKQEGEAGMAAIGTSFAAQAMASLGSALPVDAEWSVAGAKVSLGRARFNLRACVKGNWFLRILGAPVNWTIATAFPRKTEIRVVRLGDQLLLTWPGEPITSLGLELKAAAATHMPRQTWVMGLTNDHLSYFVDPVEYQSESYEACSSLYGAEGGRKIVQAFTTLLATSR